MSAEQQACLLCVMAEGFALDEVRLFLDTHPGEAEALLRLYALAARGADFKSDPAWTKYESLPATTGHFFRGVE